MPSPHAKPRYCHRAPIGERCGSLAPVTPAQGGNLGFHQESGKGDGKNGEKQHFVEGSLNSKLPTIWRVEKQMKSR